MDFIRRTLLSFLICTLVCQPLLAAPKEAPEESATSQTEETLIPGKYKSSCLEWFRPLAVLKVTASVGTGLLGVGLVGLGYLGSALNKEKELRGNSLKLWNVSVVSTDETISIAEYAPTFWRQNAVGEFTLKALVDTLTEDAKRFPELKTKAKELGIPVADSLSVYNYLGVYPERVRKKAIDKIKIRPPEGLNLKYEIDVGDLRRATIKTGPWFSDHYKKMDKLVAEWLRLQYDQDKLKNPKITFSDLGMRIVEISRDLRDESTVDRVISSNDKWHFLSELLVFSNGKTTTNVTQDEIGTYLRNSLDPKLFSNGKLLDWIKKAEAQEGIKSHAYSYSGSGISVTPVFATLATPEELQQALQYCLKDNKILWSPQQNDSHGRGYRELLKNFLGKATHSKMEANPNITLEQAMRAVVQDIENEKPEKVFPR